MASRNERASMSDEERLTCEDAAPLLKTTKDVRKTPPRFATGGVLSMQAIGDLSEQFQDA